MAALDSPKVSTKNAWIEVISSSQKQKASISLKIELEKRRIIFRHEARLSQKSEADLILALNKALQEARIPTYIWFNRVSYLKSGTILVLLIKKSSVDQLVYNHLNILIKAAKVVDLGVIRVEVLEC